MKPLYDHRGQVVAFLSNNGRIISRAGESLAWIHQNRNVYDYQGRHLGWWERDHMRGPDGGVVIWLTEVQDLGVIPPVPAVPPIAPIATVEPLRPLPSLPPVPPLRSLGWSRYQLTN